MKNTFRALWNAKLIIEARCTGVMAYQLCQLMADEFIGAARDDVLRDASELIKWDMGQRLPMTHIVTGDKTGSLEILINL